MPQVDMKAEDEHADSAHWDEWLDSELRPGGLHLALQDGRLDSTSVTNMVKQKLNTTYDQILSDILLKQLQH